MKKIIIAEPILRFIETGNTLFGRGSITVYPARTSEDVFALHREHNADIIATDVALPVMGGLQLCSLIRKDAGLKGVSIIMLCDGTEPSRAACLQAGANEVLTNPVDPIELFTRISELLVIPRRQDMRTTLRVSSAGRRENLSFLGMSRNISISGMLLETEQELEKGERLSCKLEIGSREITVDCEVMRARKNSQGGFHYGVKFINLDIKSLIIIDQFVQGKLKH
jgi:DNA-binding response OmpR family regulator